MFMMFADVGGLYDFLVIGLAPIFDLVAKKFMHAKLLQSLFLVASKP